MHARWVFAAGYTQKSVVSVSFDWAPPSTLLSSLEFRANSAWAIDCSHFRSYPTHRSHPDTLRGRDAIGTPPLEMGAMDPPILGPAGF